MTTGAADGLDFQTPKKKKSVERFTVDGTPVTVTKPKWAWFERVGIRATSDDPVVRQAATDELLDKVFDKKSADLLRGRLAADDDDFDIDDLGDLTQILVEKWGGDREAKPRPTGPSGTSSGASRRTTKRSTARSR